MASELYDCPWCGSAKSIEHGLCQVCLIEFAVETKVIELPSRRAAGVSVVRPEPKGAATSE